MKNTLKWISAMRLRTLPLSISGIIIASCFAEYNGVFDIKIFALAILTTLSYQILSNLANDYGDGVKGTDNDDRIGPQRALQSGAITKEEMFNAIRINILISIVLTVGLVYYSFGSDNLLLALLFFGLAGLAVRAAVKYTVGKSAYGYRGKGDIYVFIFFGLVSVIGCYVLYAKQIDHVVILPAISVGLLSTAVLNLNNMRDINSDLKSNKITLAVKLGPTKAKLYHYTIILLAMFITVVFAILYFTGSIYNLLFLIAFIPLSLHLKRIKTITDPKDYDPELKKVALSTVLFCILLGIGYLF
ncbi:1,4-dihydroxy-2-naphthoate octaprenyltransferase [Mesoflavibacter zeaxanthinifaciens]|uniref:1,4-dihydroxy-2-naphthoate octaprenyltransferase n=1 Tax=Mesoflavibacter zeaxanthinifaciens TaxID=393060 RepID=UPI0026EA7B25|nr:1,4-dihydroxy-2-naphthoate octaprenyltransferase [Mesoflavibacter zeaxanthinifaciens]